MVNIVMMIVRDWYSTFFQTGDVTVRQRSSPGQYVGDARIEYHQAHSSTISLYNQYFMHDIDLLERSHQSCGYLCELVARITKRS